MASATLARRWDDVNRKQLSMSLQSSREAGKVLSDDEALIEHGRLIRRAFELAGYTQDQVQQALRYANPGQISKWTTGQQPAPVHRLRAQLAGFRAAYLQALAEDEVGTGNPNVIVETNVRLRRTA